MPYTYEYPRPSVTVDCILFGFDEGEMRILLIQRGGEPFRGMWALPGGCFAGFHIACSSPAFRSGSYLCSAHPLHSLLPPFRFIAFHSQAQLFCIRSMVFNPCHSSYPQTHILLLQIRWFISLHFHYTLSFIHFSRLQSTRCP